ncbi:hypothetical protein Dimus_033041 [Dionaea muscipula]
MQHPHCSFLFISLSLFLLLHVRFTSAAASDGLKPDLLGGYQPIKNVNDPQIIQIAEFAVSEHNKKARPVLKFVKLENGAQQVVAGVNYRLLIRASDSGGVSEPEPKREKETGQRVPRSVTPGRSLRCMSKYVWKITDNSYVQGEPGKARREREIS